jgi:hypothetical protein
MCTIVAHAAGPGVLASLNRKEGGVAAGRELGIQSVISLGWVCRRAPRVQVAALGSRMDAGCSQKVVAASGVSSQ